jgi:hypothetical protein
MVVAVSINAARYAIPPAQRVRHDAVPVAGASITGTSGWSVSTPCPHYLGIGTPAINVHSNAVSASQRVDAARARQMRYGPRTALISSARGRRTSPI